MIIKFKKSKSKKELSTELEELRKEMNELKTELKWFKFNYEKILKQILK